VSTRRVDVGLRAIGYKTTSVVDPGSEGTAPIRAWLAHHGVEPDQCGAGCRPPE
jgi:hypothetical protein